MYHVVVGHNLMDVVFGGVEFGAFLYLGDEQRHGIDALHRGDGL